METGYDLESVKIARLSGGMLKFFAGAVRNPATRPLLLPSLLKSGGFDKSLRMTIMLD
jgi:hypothetical protein